MGLFDRDHSRQLDRIEALLRLVLRSSHTLIHMENFQMTIIEDIAAVEEQTLVRLASISNAHTAVKAALDAQTEKIAQLTSDLLGAVNSGASPGQLQAVLDKANAILAASDNAAVAAAALLNTGSGESPPVDEEPAVAKIASISPTSGTEAGGDTVSIFGSGFGDTKDVTFGGVSASFTINNDTSISAISPPGTGSADVVVVGQDASSEPVQFSYVAAEVVPEPEPVVEPEPEVTPEPEPEDEPSTSRSRRR